MASADDLARVVAAMRDGDDAALGDPDPTVRAAAELIEALLHDLAVDRIELPPDALVYLGRRVAQGTAIEVFRWSATFPFGIEPARSLVGVVVDGAEPYREDERRPVDDSIALAWVHHAKAGGLVAERECPSGLRLEGRYVLPGGRPTTDATPVFRLDVDERLVAGGPAVFVCTVRGEDGFFVADGERSRWYPATDPRPRDGWRGSWTVGRIHVGRLLLGMSAGPIVHETAGPLADDVFEARYRAALETDLAAHDRHPLGNWEPLGRNAKRYAERLAARGAHEELRAFVARLAPHWNHNAGFSALAEMSFLAGDLESARTYAEKLVASYPEHYRASSMAVLARVYAATGERDDGIVLLEDCLARIDRDPKCQPSEKVRFSTPLLEALSELRKHE